MKTADRARVFVLRHTPYGDSDLILQGIASDGRRLSFIARGARRSRKRFGGGILEPGCHLEVVYTDSRQKRGGDSELLTLKEATLICGFDGLRSSWVKLNAALEAIKTMSDLRDLDGPEVYDLLGHSLKAIEAAADPERILVHFRFRLLAIQGVLSPEGPWGEIVRLRVREFAQRTWDDLDWGALIQLSRDLVKRFKDGLNDAGETRTCIK